MATLDDLGVNEGKPVWSFSTQGEGPGGGGGPLSPVQRGDRGTLKKRGVDIHWPL